MTDRLPADRGKREFRLAIACCRWPPSPLQEDQIRASAAGVDWDLFLAVVRRHRIEGLAHDGLKRAGVTVAPGVAAVLAAAARATLTQNLFFATEAGRLHQAFAGAGLQHLFVKGLTVNMLAYGSLGLKRSFDIDLLVEPSAYHRACDLLESLGYSLVHPPPGSSRRQVLRYAREEKDSRWRSRDGILVELHQRLVDNPEMLPAVTARSPDQRVQIADGIDLPTLGRDELFAYLCVHGALAAWSRLKWAADLAALLHGEDASGLDSLYRRAVRIAPRRCVGQALLLCRILFDLPLSDELERQLRADGRILRLVAAAMMVMTQGQVDRELRAQPFGTWRVHLLRLLLHSGWRYRAGEIRRTAWLGYAWARRKLRSARTRRADPA